MSYRIQNLLTTRKDPSRRGRAPLLARKPVLIGTRILQPGEVCTVSDAYYERSKARITEYVGQGVITAKYFVAAVQEEAVQATPTLVGVDEAVVKDTTVVLDNDAEQLASLSTSGSAPVVEKIEEEPVEVVAVVEEKKPVVSELDALLAAPPKRNKKG